MIVLISSIRPFFGWRTPCGLLLGVVLIVGCTSHPNAPLPPLPGVTAAPPSLLVLRHGDDATGEHRFEQTRHVLNYAKIPYEATDLASVPTLPTLDSYRTVVVTTERLGVLSIADARRLLRFVEDGGGLVVLTRGWHPMLGPAFGHPTAFDPAFTLLPDEQLQFNGHLMGGAENLTLDSLSLSMLDFESTGSDLDPTATVLASAHRSGKPVAWLFSYGQGRTVFWNIDQLTGKSFRGTILQSITAVQPYSVRSMANWGVIYLDDFPSPGPSTKAEPIASELGLTVADFYATQWYPDMRHLAEEFGLRYTSTVVFSYNGSVTPPYRFDEWLNGRIVMNGEVVYYSPWIAREDGEYSEMALHGYNHQPLRLANWSSPSHMTQALTAARERWRIDDIAPLPRTYVPPMNQIDSTGMQALTEVFPSLNTVAGLYGGDFSLGQDREFGPDPWNDALYALPRNTSGYILTDMLQLSMVSQLEVLGAWGHFVHPDEVFPNEDRLDKMRELGIALPEGGFRWYGEPARDGMYYRFKEWLTFARTHYPWLRYMTAQKATATMKSYKTLSWRESMEDGTIQIHTSQTPSFFVVHSRPGTSLSQIEGGDLLHRSETDLLAKFVIRATTPHVTLQLASTYASSN